MAGRIPQSFINDLIDRADIVDIVDGRVQLKKSGKNYSGLCPFHDEKTASFTVSPDKQFFHCFGCQESGTVLTFLMKFERLDFVEAVEALAQHLGLEVPREQGRSHRPERDTHLYDVLALAEKHYRQALRGAEHAIEYLKGRGVTGEIARDFGIGYAADAWDGVSTALAGTPESQLLDAGLLTKNERGRVYDRFRDRIMFPIRDTRGRTIGFGGRALEEGGPKYLNSPETEIFHKGQELYGLYEARKALRNLDSLIVVEGYMDVVALAQFGVANVVATLGTASGRAHFEKLYRYTDEVICCFDGDPAGRQAAWKALENALPVLNEHRTIKLVFLPDGEDPDSLVRKRGKQGLAEFLEHGTPGLEFLLHKLAEGLDLKSLDDRARYVGLANPYVEKLPSGVLQTMLREQIRELTGFAPRANDERRRSQPQKVRHDRFNVLSERLLTYLLRAPEIWQIVPLEGKAGAREAFAQLGLLGQLMKFIDESEGPDTDEVLVHWSDESTYPEMLRLAQRPLELDESVIGQEFIDGLERLLELVEAHERKQTVAELKNAPNIDELRKYWRERKGGDDYS